MQAEGEKGIEESGRTRLLRAIPLFSCLDPLEFSEVQRRIMEKRFHKNQVVLLEEDTANYMYIVYGGKVRVVHLGSEGSERILAVHKRGDVFGEMALLDAKTAPATVIAMEDAEIGLLSKETFDTFFLGNHRVLLQLVAILCRRLREAQLVLKAITLPDAEQRLRSILNHLSQLHGVRDARGIVIALRLTHKELAGYTSVSRETVTRLLHRMVLEGDLEMLQNRTILLKPGFRQKAQLL
ncbi:transcriptional regulator, Crp/Fnr family [Citrifermentans bemidjiense Bem]|uniref:Transcriptional regulator, Crp/Fnr family n=1 Tax=Citrifermentans bemidjiense (strain ATCC BAA-1014 / DSM 16622 / JCM 12645 / Bem) TaxID=404380 RepID=B5EGL8_CITBB|nr:Crp/Fnr family transcriptional regulator [Citrifermentans bemidjiense]ACH38083.1 transcriptional regulator, Crp/Fnr family [Citrifermentans bemidjiense Bem]